MKTNFIIMQLHKIDSTIKEIETYYQWQMTDDSLLKYTRQKAK